MNVTAVSRSVSLQSRFANSRSFAAGAIFAFAEVPPRVEYTITELALEMLELIHPLWQWAAANVGRLQASQANYDRDRAVRVLHK